MKKILTTLSCEMKQDLMLWTHSFRLEPSNLKSMIEIVYNSVNLNHLI
jgi:hypothetical protein